MKRRSPPRSRRNARPPPPPSVGILDVAFHRASLASPKSETKAQRDRLRARLKVVRAGATVVRQLDQWTRPLRGSALSPFETTLVSSRFGDGTLGRSLLRVARARSRIRGLQQESERAVQRGSDSTEYGDEVRRFYGRLASHVREIDADLERLAEIRGFLRQRPHLEPGTPTLVVAGFPNVGKSALVAKLSSAHPKVAEYPFTTLAIEVGHADLGFDRWQVLDTPGVLGRSGRSNPAEREAAVAVDRAASVVLFVIDPSSSSGYTLDEQEQLLARWQQELNGRPIIVVESKADLTPDRGSGRLRVSAVTGEGIEELRRAIESIQLPQPPIPSAEGAVEEEPLEPPTFDDPEGSRPNESPGSSRRRNESRDRNRS